MIAEPEVADAPVLKKLALSAPVPTTFTVTLTQKDAAVVLEQANEQYRTPAQQVGWIVSQAFPAHLKEEIAGSGVPRWP